MKKKIIIGVLIAALIAGGTAGGAVYYRKSHQNEVSVVSVDSVASQYYTDDTSLEGNIATSAVQKYYYRQRYDRSGCVCIQGGFCQKRR